MISNGLLNKEFLKDAFMIEDKIDLVNIKNTVLLLLRNYHSTWSFSEKFDYLNDINHFIVNRKMIMKKLIR